VDRHFRIERLKVHPTTGARRWHGAMRGWRWHLFREWCFARTVAKRLGWRLVVLVACLLGGAALIRELEPEKGHGLLEAVYHAWFLLLGNPTEDVPASPFLKVVFFLLPLAGLMIVIESLVELSVIVRHRQEAEQPWNRIMASSMSDHVVLVGVGRLGYSTFMLLRKLGQPVVVIDRDAQGQFLGDVRRDGSPLLIGDGRRDELLKEAGIERARAIVLATEDDLANLEMALDARRFNPQIRVVLRMFDQNMADKIAGAVNIRLAMSQSAISAPAFAAAAIEPSIVACNIIDDRMVVMVSREVVAGDPLAGKTVGEVAASLRCVVVSKRAKGRAELFPGAGAVVSVGDGLVLQGTFEQVGVMRGNRVVCEG
jgi:Trk K+ transport system NAD-binding subunit